MHGCTGGVGEHVTGALGEVAFGLWLGRPFRLTLGTYRSVPDFSRTEVRTRTCSYWDLIVRADDDPSRAYVLVVPFGSSGRSWRLAGWCWGASARQDAWLASHGGREQAWFVPQPALRHMDSYRDAVLP